jgi:hypothetical protein
MIATLQIYNPQIKIQSVTKHVGSTISVGDIILRFAISIQDN